MFFNLQNNPTIHSEEKLVNLVRGRECFVGLSILLVLCFCPLFCIKNLVKLVHLLIADVQVGHLELLGRLEAVTAADPQVVARLPQLQQGRAQALLVLHSSDYSICSFIFGALGR